MFLKVTTHFYDYRRGGDVQVGSECLINVNLITTISFVWDGLVGKPVDVPLNIYKDGHLIGSSLIYRVEFNGSGLNITEKDKDRILEKIECYDYI